MQDILINCEPVELYKIFKFENIASSGGEAKLMIENAYWTTRVTERGTAYATLRQPFNLALALHQALRLCFTSSASQALMRD